MSCKSCKQSCIDKFGCPQVNAGGSVVCPDFSIKRHDTKPSFSVEVKDCDGPMDLTGLVLEASMWAKGKLKRNVSSTDTYFGFADDIGFYQTIPNDIIVIDDIRSPEQMLVIGFDETNKLVSVSRGYNGTIAKDYTKGKSFKIFRMLNAVAEIEMTYEDQIQFDGTVKEDVLVSSKLVYEWQANDTCVPGCFWLEFKLLKMEETNSSFAFSYDDPNIPISSISFTPYNSDQLGCSLGLNVEWVRRFPESDAFLIKIYDSPTSENLIL